MTVSCGRGDRGVVGSGLVTVVKVKRVAAEKRRKRNEPELRLHTARVVKRMRTTVR